MRTNAYRDKRFAKTLESYAVGEVFSAAEFAERSALLTSDQVGHLLRGCACVERVTSAPPYRYRRVEPEEVVR